MLNPHASKPDLGRPSALVPRRARLPDRIPVAVHVFATLDDDAVEPRAGRVHSEHESGAVVLIGVEHHDDVILLRQIRVARFREGDDARGIGIVAPYADDEFARRSEDLDDRAPDGHAALLRFDRDQARDRIWSGLPFGFVENAVEPDRGRQFPGAQAQPICRRFITFFFGGIGGKGGCGSAVEHEGSKEQGPDRESFGLHRGSRWLGRKSLAALRSSMALSGRLRVAPRNSVRARPA